MKIYKTYRGFKIALSHYNLSEGMRKYFKVANPLFKEMYKRSFVLRKGTDILSTIFEIVNPQGEIIFLPRDPKELERYLVLICPKCGTEMFHEETPNGGIRHYCPKCGYEFWGKITDGSCAECAREGGKNET